MNEIWNDLPKTQRICVMLALKVALMYTSAKFSKDQYIQFCEDTWDFIDQNDKEEINEFIIESLYEEYV